VDALETALPNEISTEYVQRVSYLKAQAAVVRRKQRQLESLPILSADTIVAINNRILGKPTDQQDAQQMLGSLSGTTHQVLTSICLFAPDNQYYAALSISEVRFRRLSAEDIQRYLDSGEAFGKAGAYAIQGRAAEFVEHIGGSYSGIMGLPLFETARLLRQFGLL
jgi:septum formation protein